MNTPTIDEVLAKHSKDNMTAEQVRDSERIYFGQDEVLPAMREWALIGLRRVNRELDDKSKEIELLVKNNNDLKDKCAALELTENRNKGLYRALQGLVKDVRSKPNDTRYDVHLKIAEAVLQNYQI